MQRRGDKPVVYLDQNWISNITKASIDDWNGPDKAYFGRLSTAIQEGVDGNRFACPTSGFHETEASYGSKVKDSLWFVAKELSRGLHFNSPIQISHHQLLEAATKFAGHRPPDLPWWTIPFNRDPDADVDPLPREPIQVHVSVDELATEGKRLRDGIQIAQYREFKRERNRHGLSYESEVKLGMMQLFVEGHVGPLIAVNLPSVAESPLLPFFTQGVIDSLEHAMELIEICESGGGLGQFLGSTHFSKSPFLSIYAKLRAADIVRFPYRNPEPSILEDFHIIATVLPYASALATENYMAELLRQTRIDEDYGCRVFRMSKKEEFLRYLSAL